ncbi:DNA polymerase I [Nitrosomonas marina]|uniref:DNA polymerase I n=1 Tax=Nitrosomonas marina TaxID=917 RepID=A0A1H8DPZ4_9PROT|nr:DNA polymerase I [Nitrosomonas marina]SEN09342.1 DNA polymerase I [Nitrosomonas marina]
MKTLLLVDASSYLYRAYHALPDLRSQHNKPTGAIHGVLNMLRRLHKDYHADYSACVFDAKGKTFRDEIYPQYKAHRPSMPEDLIVQIEPLHACIEAMGWPILAIDGVEADDVIGTLAKQAEAAEMRCIISTGDKDIAQLVNAHITLVNTMNNDVLDEQRVYNKFGVRPDQMLDYLMLVGDSTDNIPGVEKVGPKTAVKWLTQYGSLENIIAHAIEIKGIVGENLRRALDWFDTARKLVKIKCDVELPVAVTELTQNPQDTERLAALYEELGMKTALQELRQQDGENATAQPPATPVVYQTILTEAALNEWVDRLNNADLVSIDTETTSLNPMEAKLVGISLSVESQHAAYLPLMHDYLDAPQQLEMNYVVERLRPWLENMDKPKLGQNLKYDKHVFANHGIRFDGIEHDTLLQSYVLESHRPHNMDSMAQRHLDVKTVSYDEVTGKGAQRLAFSQVSVETATHYAAEDADVTLRLHQYLYPKIQADPRQDYIYRHIEMPAMAVLFEMERQGVLLDQQLLRKQSEALNEKMILLEQQAYKITGQPFNLNSPKQIQEILFEQLKLPVIKKTPKGVPSTNEDVLQKLALDYPLPKILLDYRALAKLKSTYTDKLPQMINSKTGRVHTNYAQAVAVTGRLASSDPNLQNIPVRTQEGRRIREAFIAPPGSQIISADYSQIELRIMAHISKDRALLDAFAAGEDIHRATASEIFALPPEEIDPEQRRYAKVINFGLIYGMSEYGLAAQLGIERSAARMYMDRYFSRYPGVADYMQRTRENAKSCGFVETVLGRRLWLPDIGSANGSRRQGAERAAINAPMQGTAADIIKLAMIAVHQWLSQTKLQSQLIMQVHDELVLEVPDGEVDIVKSELPDRMCRVIDLDVPLLVDVGAGKNWEQAH